jgi:signal transduction histidine kinase
VWIFTDRAGGSSAQGCDGTLSAEHTRGSPPVHGVQRFHDGLDVGEVVAEYNLLRVAFITVAERHHFYLVGEAARIINHRIDEAVRMAVMAFAAQQALIHKEHEDQHLAFIVHDLRTPLYADSVATSSSFRPERRVAISGIGESFVEPEPKTWHRSR